MNKILLLIAGLILLCSCKKGNEFENDFDGGKFSLTVIQCEEEESLEEDFILRRTNREIEIFFFGECLYDFYDYDIKGGIGTMNDTINLIIDRNKTVKEKYKDKSLVLTNCLCINKVKFNFDNSISADLPVKLNGHWIDKLPLD
jgi:hypothetical protein